MSSVLLISAETGLRELARAGLTECGYNVTGAATLAEAVAFCQTALPDAALIDFEVAGESGIEGISQIRSAAPETAILMMADIVKSEDVFQALYEGASDIVHKPLLPAEVDIRLRNLLRKRDHRRAIQKANAALDREKGILLRYFPEDAADELLAGKLNANLRGELQDISVFFLGVKKSGQILSRLGPSEFAEFLNQSMVDSMDLVAKHGGAVNKLNGAGLLATFGLPRRRNDDAKRAIECAREIREHFDLMNEAAVFSFGNVEIGIGIASGQVFAGNIGSFRRMEYTIIGDTANVAARLMGLSGKRRGTLLSDRRTVERSGLDGCEMISNMHVRGRKGEVLVYRV